MTGSRVFFTDFHTRPGQNMLHKLQKLLKQAGLGDIDVKGKYVAIKTHFGEVGNLAYIRPDYSAVLVEMLKERGAKVFLTDTGTLYSGHRNNAVDHLATAYRHGFSPLTVGCNVIIADGLKGLDYREIPIDGAYCPAPRIGSVIADCDVLISLAHFKGHEITGIGGSLKNVGMGCGSLAGKLEMHSASKPYIDEDACTACGICADYCQHLAVDVDDELDAAVIDYDKCTGCCQCVVMCEFNAVRIRWDEAAELTTYKMAEYAQAALKGKSALFINFVSSVSPQCDCWSHNDVPLVADIGIAASVDPVALDRACADMVNQAPHMPGSVLESLGFETGQDKFTRVHPATAWRKGLDYAEKIGLGSQSYELIKI